MVLKYNTKARKSNNLKYRQIFHLFVEGDVTEEQYFGMINRLYDSVVIKVYRSKHKSHPEQVLERAIKFLERNKLDKNESLCLVVDIDERPKDDFTKLVSWVRENSKFAMVTSNPCFELWLLYHYDNGHKVSDKESCLRKLKQCLPHFQKNRLTMDDVTSDMISKACERAKLRHKQCDNVFSESCSTVYLLLERIITAT